MMPFSRYFCIFIKVGLGEGSFGFRNLVAFTTAGVTSWTVPEELRKGRKCYVKVIGGGASGGIGSITASAVTCGGGGGGGGVLMNPLMIFIKIIKLR
ncbi:hypothetical protein [Escherichia coli]|uniref:hypothetical protein n=1 Tax=Escherichia coli TaxID=562 RepID=UPI0021B2F7A3|nr:hypothetical protein [Escherichia coli]